MMYDILTKFSHILHYVYICKCNNQCLHGTNICVVLRVCTPYRKVLNIISRVETFYQITKRGIGYRFANLTIKKKSNLFFTTTRNIDKLRTRKYIYQTSIRPGYTSIENLIIFPLVPITARVPSDFRPHSKEYVISSGGEGEGGGLKICRILSNDSYNDFSI